MAPNNHIVYSGLGDAKTHAPGTLFESWTFWIAIRVPQRSLYVQKVEQNGGRVVPLEKNADIMIADHLRKDAPPGTFSYKWIDQCIANGSIVDQNQYRAGPSKDNEQVRAVGASTATKSGRNPFTAEDDRVLYRWVKDMEKQGGAVKGNEIYKQLEQQNNRHPWQSWRDRWIKYVSLNPPTSTLSQETPPTPPSDNDREGVDTHVQAEASKSSEKAAPSVTLPEPRETSHLELVPSQAASSEKPKSQSEQHKPVTSVRISESSGIERTSESHSLQLPQDSPSPTRLTSKPKQGQILQKPVADTHEAHVAIAISNEDHTWLFDNAYMIQNVPVGKYDSFWRELPIHFSSNHSPAEWREYYETVILPEWEQNQAANGDKEVPHPSQIGHPMQLATAVGELPFESGRKRSPLITESLLMSITPTTKKRKLDDSDHDRQNPSKRRGEASYHVDAANTAENILSQSPQPDIQRHSVGPGSTTESPAVAFPGDVNTDANEGAEGMRKSAAEPYDSKQVFFVDLLDSDNEEDNSGPTNDIPNQPREALEFGIYEDRQLPEEEKENVVIDDSGSFSLPPRHVHVRSEEALDAFSDPLPKFTLQDNSHEIDINLRHEDGEESLGEIRGVYEDSKPDPHKVTADEVAEFEEHNSEDADSLPVPRQLQFETQHILDVETQLLDLDVPPPPDEDALMETAESQQSEGLFVSDDPREEPEFLFEEVDDDDDDDEDEFYEVMEAQNANAGRVTAEELLDYLDVAAPPDLEIHEEDGAREASAESDNSTPIAADTQVILNSETQYLDLSVPLPPSSSQDVPSSPPQPPSSHPTISKITIRKNILTSSPPTTPTAHLSPPPAPHSDADQADALEGQSDAPSTEDPDLSAFIAQQTTLGHPESNIIYALQRTCMDFDLALRILELCRRGEPLPTNQKGIWTEEHDGVLQGGDAREIRRLEVLHGREAVSMRVDLLLSFEDVDGDE